MPESHSTLAQHLTRRTFLGQGSRGLGALAFASLMNPTLLRAEEKWRGVVNPLHLARKAKRVIYLCMAGGPSHLETLDFKPVLRKQHGQPMPESITKGKQIAQLQGQALKCYGPEFNFKKFGNGGADRTPGPQKMVGMPQRSRLVVEPRSAHA